MSKIERDAEASTNDGGCRSAGHTSAAIARDTELIRRSISGQPDATKELVARATPIIRARVTRVLFKLKGSFQPFEELRRDLTQDVLCSLFVDGQGALLEWAPSRGLSLANFVGLIAARKAVSQLRGKSSYPIAAELCEPNALEDLLASDDGEELLLTRDLVTKLFERLPGLVSQQGLDLFERIYCDEQSVAEIQERLGLTREAVYQWKSRLRKIALSVLLDVDPSSLNLEGPRPESSRSARACLET